MTPLSYHLLNLLLIALETMRLPVQIVNSVWVPQIGHLELNCLT